MKGNHKMEDVQVVYKVAELQQVVFSGGGDGFEGGGEGVGVF